MLTFKKFKIVFLENKYIFNLNFYYMNWIGKFNFILKNY